MSSLSRSSACARRSLRVFAVAAAVACALPATTAAQSIWRADRSFSFFAENDALWGASDSSYTNGVRAGWDFLVWNDRLEQIARAVTLTWLSGRLPLTKPAPAMEGRCVPYESRADTRPCGSVAFGLSQTIYTPSDIVTPSLQAGDRPFVGFLAASMGVSTLYAKWQVSSDLQIGVMGPWAGSEHTQSLAHWTWASGSEKPRGWHNQLRNSMHVALINNYSWRAFEWCRARSGCNGTYTEERVFDVTPRGELVAGSPIGRASGGGIARLGLRFPDVVGLSRIPTTAARSAERGPQPWIALHVSYDARRVWHNAFIDGTSADDGPTGWRTRSGISATPNVTELAFGGAAGLYGITLTAQIVERSKEYTPGGGGHRFGTVTFSLATLGSGGR